MLTILCPLLYALAILLAPRQRRRTLMTIGFAALFAGVLVLAGRRILEDQIPGSLTTDASLQVTIRAVVSISTGLLKDVATGVVFIGGAADRGRLVRRSPRLPRAGARGDRAVPARTSGPTFAFTLGLLALLFLWDPIPATGTPAGIITFTVLALFGTEVLVRQTAAEFPEAMSGAPGGDPHTLDGQNGSPRAANQVPPGHNSDRSTVDELKQLAELRDRGELTPDEVQPPRSRICFTPKRPPTWAPVGFSAPHVRLRRDPAGLTAPTSAW